MSNISIGRYEPGDCGQWSGWVEGVDNEGTSWITYLDALGRPALHWSQREETGAVIGDPIVLVAA